MVYGLVPEMTSDDYGLGILTFFLRGTKRRGEKDGEAMVESASLRFLSFTEEGISGH
jgi:hypothetical protein